MALCTLGGGTSSLGGGSDGGSSFSCSDLETCLDVTFPGSVRIGTLYVTGSGIIEHPVDLYIGDPLIGLNTGVLGANTHDIGWLGERGTNINIASIWDESSDHFALISTTDDSSVKGNVTIDEYANLKVDRLFATGRIGIGTDTPSFSLQIEEVEAKNYAPSSTEYAYPSGIMTYLDNEYLTNSVALMAFKARKTASVWYAGNAGSQNDGAAAAAYSGPFVVGNRDSATSYSEKMRIDANGNVGIGTTAPTTQLAVSGTISGATGIFTYEVDVGTGTAAPTLLASGGKVGILTGDPATELQVIGTISGTTVRADHGYFVQTLHVSGVPVSTGGPVPGSSNLGNGWTINQNLRTTDSVVFDTVSGTTLISGVSGLFSEKVGIGTSDPTYPLEVAGDVGFDEYIYHNDNPSTYIRFATDLVNLVAGGWSALKLDKSTNKIQLNNTNRDLDVQIMAADGNVILHTDAVTTKVGIGTISPTTELAVSGTISGQSGLFRDHLFVSGSGLFDGALAVGHTQPSGTVGSIVATNDILASYSSDERLKDNITPIPDSLNKISQIAGVEFDWNEKAYSHLAGHDVGVIAQQLEQVLPEAVNTRDDGYKAVKYEKIIPLLIEGFKEQGRRISALEEKLKD